MRDEIAACCRKLKLSRNIVDNCTQFTSDSHQEYLLKLLRLELEHRYQVRTGRLIKKAGFNTLKSLDGYITTDITMPGMMTWEELKSCNFITEKQNLIMYGNVGTGKTHLATALGIEACHLGKNVGFYHTARLVNQLSQMRKDGRLSAFMNKLSRLDLLICDEWGYVPLEREACQILFQIISDCYEKRSIIITTNLEFSKWIHVFYDEQMTSALIDRLIHHSHLLLFNGPSWRIKYSTIRNGNFPTQGEEI